MRVILDRLSELLGRSLPPSAYVVHGARECRRAAVGVVLPLAAVIALTVGTRAMGFDHGWGLAIVVWIVFGGYSLVTALRRPELLRIDADGVRFRDILVPWPSVRQVVILREPYGAEPAQVGVRRRRGAPLPEGLDSLVRRPGDPVGIDPRMRSHVTGTVVDVERVVVAVRAFAPHGVELLERVGDRESVLSR